MGEIQLISIATVTRRYKHWKGSGRGVPLKHYSLEIAMVIETAHFIGSSP